MLQCLIPVAPRSASTPSPTLQGRQRGELVPRRSLRILVQHRHEFKQLALCLKVIWKRERTLKRGSSCVPFPLGTPGHAGFRRIQELVVVGAVPIGLGRKSLCGETAPKPHQAGTPRSCLFPQPLNPFFPSLASKTSPVAQPERIS